MTLDTPSWSTLDSAALYRLDDWSLGYFGISDDGSLAVRPTGGSGPSLDLHEVVTGLVARGINTPVVLRFPELLRHRMGRIASAFRDAMAEVGFTGGYSCVYPIKVNQQRHLCAHICDVADGLGFGLEVGSKPELLAGLALTAGRNGMPLVCNGFKDEEFIETVVLATKMGRNVIPVVEQFRELEMLAHHAGAHGVKPSIGIRARLSASGIGRWAGSSGAQGKFGLSVSEILAAVSYLEERGLLEALRMLHCHIGSQIYDIRAVKYAVNELAHLYAELVRRGAPVEILDIGGGLGVDYDGTQSASESSINYSLEQYALDVVHRVHSICEEAEVPHPLLMTESGRALVAHSSILVFDVLGARRQGEPPDADLLERAKGVEHLPQPLQDMLDAFEGRDTSDPMELSSDAAHAMDEAMSLFNLGFMDLEARALVEQLYWSVGRAVVERLGQELPEELESVETALSDLYFANLSVFQSLIDSWGINQVFPVMPIHRLHERPDRQGRIVDITCDSDGRIPWFQGEDGPQPTITLHSLRQAESSTEGASALPEPYYLAVFLTGAYQETLGDLHNLFGDTHVVHVSSGPNDGWRIEELVEGDTVREVLQYLQFDTERMRDDLRRDTEAAFETGRLTLPEAASLRRFLDDGLNGYTYLE